MTLVLVGCNHRTAPVEIREQLAFEGLQVDRALEGLRQQFAGSEFVVLSTCNRVEIYTAHRDPAAVPASEPIGAFFAAFHGVPSARFSEYLYARRDAEAARHLFRVAGGLDSMMLGEDQILAQVRQAYGLAQTKGTIGPITHALFQRALSVGKEIRSTTGINRGKVSVASVAVERVRDVFDHFADKTVLVIGAGKMGDLTLRHLRQLQPGRVLVTNRNPDRAREAAQRWQGRAMSYDQLEEALVQADVILSTTAAREPIVHRPLFERVMQRRRFRPVFVIDIAVPRDFDPAIGALDNVYLYNIDDLERVRQENVRERQTFEAHSQWIIDQNTQEFMGRLAHHSTSPVLVRLTQDLDAMRQAEAERLFARLPHLTEVDRQEIGQALLRLQNKFLHRPRATLKDESLNGPPHGLLDVLKRLFHLSD